MSATLISRNVDLARLEAEGFRLRIVQATANHLLIDGVPAVTAAKTVELGTLYCPLILDQDGITEKPCPNHQCWWIGSPPCNAEGDVMKEMISNASAEDKGDGITTTVAFSRKLGNKEPYVDHYEKVRTYVDLIWHEARAIDPACDPRSNKPVKAVVTAQETVFWYPDMATTRAGIGAATAKLLAKRVAIIGLGGTGSYILDLLAKVPIEQLHLYDGDVLKLHNVFRAPGAPSAADLTEPKKVDWFAGIYGRMHKGIIPHAYHVDASNLEELKGFDFVFVAIDDGAARKIALQGLIAMGVPLIDVGLDIDIDSQGRLRGMCRVTAATTACNAHVEEVISFASAAADDLYRNIQVADLNMKNAAMAVTKWKKLCGFYADDTREHHSVYTLDSHSLSKEDKQ